MMHKESELTQFIKFMPPVRDGVYQVMNDAGTRVIWAYWSRKNGWGGGCDSLEMAYHRRTGCERDWFEKRGGWRGLAYDPSLPKKLARSTDPATSKEAAAKIVKSGALKSHCAKIRACLVEHGRMTPSEIASKLKMRRSSVFRRMSDLKRDGFASRTGEKRGGQSVWNAI